MSKVANTIVKGGSFALIGLLGGAILQYAYNIILGNIYGAELTGVFAFGLSIANIGLVLAQLGTGETLLKFSSAYNSGKDFDKLKGLFKFILPIVSVGITVVCLLFFFFFDAGLNASGKEQYSGTLLQFIFLIIPLGIVQVISRVFQGVKRLDLMALVREIGKPLSVLICLSISYLLSFEFESFAIFYLVVSVFLCFFAITLFYRKFSFLKSYKSNTETKGWRKYTFSVMIIDIFRSAGSWIDILLLGFLLPAASVGIYFTSVRIALLATLGLTAVNAIFSPIIAELWAKKDIEELGKAYKLTTRWGVMLVFPISIFIIFLSTELMLMFGDDFAPGGYILSIIVIGRLINGFTGGVGRLLVMSSYQKVEMYNTFLTVGLLLTGLLVFVPMYGLTGAAIINTVVIGFMNLLKLFQVKHFLGIQPYEWKYLKIIIAGLAGGFCIYFLKDIFENNWLTILFCGSVFVSVYSLVFILLRPEKEDLAVFSNIKNKLKRKKS